MSLFDRIKAKLGSKAVQPCPLVSKGTLVIVMTRTDTGAPIQNAGVTIEGATPGHGSTDNLGAVIFPDRTPGAYSANVALPAQLRGYRVAREVLAGSVAAGGTEILSFKAMPIGNLRVEIYDDLGALLPHPIVIHASGPQALRQAPATGTHTFGDLFAGRYDVSASVPGNLYEPASVAPATIVVPPGGTGVATFHVRRLICVMTPTIEMEYKVVLLDRKLSAHQHASETKLVTDDATCIQLSATKRNGAVAATYTGGATFEVTPANVEVFIDSACKNKLAGNRISNAQLLGGAPMVLYLKAKTAGPFKARLTLDPSNDPVHIRVDGPAVEEMAVAEIEMKLHAHLKSALEALKADPDVEPIATYHTALKNLALPAQKVLTDQQKVADGRIVHVQRAGHHGRAQVVVQKLAAAQWPGGTDAYDITLGEHNGSGAIRLYDKEADGKELPLPHKMKVADLKANEMTFWAEGEEACKKLRDIVIDLGLDRAGGGLAHKAKRNGDWARCTAVKIEEVKLEYTPVTGQHTEWDEAAKRYYINLNKKADPAGRKITISACLSEKLEGIPVHIMLAPDKDNTKAANWNIDFPATATSGGANGTNSGQPVKWKDMPAALKHQDKKDRKDLLHLGGKTDKDGLVKIEVQLSRFGGDKLHPAAYLEQDPHLAKYVHGHAELEKREPKFAAIAPIQVWRKVFYQTTLPASMTMPSSAGFDSSQQKVFIEPKEVQQKPVGIGNFAKNPSRPDWQFNPGGSDDPKLCIGTHNYTEAMTLFIAATTATSPKFHVIMCDEQHDAKGVQTNAQLVVFTGAEATQDAALKATGVKDHLVTICDPPLQGGDLMVSGTWSAATDNAGVLTETHSGKLPKGNVKILKGRARKNTVQVTRPTTCEGAAGGCRCGGAPTALPAGADDAVSVTIEVLAAAGTYLGWAPGAQTTVVKGGQASHAIHATIAHEMGHLFGGVRHAAIAGIPNHPMYYQQRGGSGTHCAFGANFVPTAGVLDPTAPASYDAQGKGEGTWRDGTCIFFGYGTGKPVEWCPHCALDLIHTDLSAFK